MEQRACTAGRRCRSVCTRALAHVCVHGLYAHACACLCLSIHTHKHVLCMWGAHTKMCLHGALALGLTFDPEWKGQESEGS